MICPRRYDVVTQVSIEVGQDRLTSDGTRPKSGAYGSRVHGSGPCRRNRLPASLSDPAATPPSPDPQHKDLHYAEVSHKATVNSIGDWPFVVLTPQGRIFRRFNAFGSARLQKTGNVDDRKGRRGAKQPAGPGPVDCARRHCPVRARRVARSKPTAGDRLGRVSGVVEI